MIPIHGEATLNNIQPNSCLGKLHCWHEHLQISRVHNISIPSYHFQNDLGGNRCLEGLCKMHLCDWIHTNRHDTETHIWSKYMARLIYEEQSVSENGGKIETFYIICSKTTGGPMLLKLYPRCKDSSSITTFWITPGFKLSKLRFEKECSMLEMFKCFLTLSSTFFLTLGINSGNSWMKPKYSAYISSHKAALNTAVDWKLRTEFSQILLGTSSGSGSSEVEGGGQT